MKSEEGLGNNQIGVQRVKFSKADWKVKVRLHLKGSRKPLKGFIWAIVPDWPFESSFCFGESGVEKNKSDLESAPGRS